MKWMIGIWVLLSAMFLTACEESRPAVVSFEAPGLKVENVRLEAGEEYWETAYDSTGVMCLEAKDFGGGYAWLQFGRARKMIYLEKGKELKIGYRRVRGSRESPYTFTGDLAAENRWLDANERPAPVKFNPDIPPAEALRLIEEEAERKRQAVGEQGFSQQFADLESRREAYAAYGCFKNYRNWDGSQYPFLKKHILDEYDLLPSDVYRSFMLEALFALAGEGKTGYSPFEYTDFQLRYVDGQLKNEAIRNFLASSLILGYMERRGTDKIKGLMEIAQRLMNNDEDREKVGEVFTKWNAVAKGTPAGDYTFEDCDGKPVSLSDFRGKYVFIDCWATWCGPCLNQLKPLQKLEHEYAGKNIVFLSISSDGDRNKWKKYVTEQKLGGIQVIDSAASAFSRHFAINAIPRFIMLDPEGNVYDAMAPRPSEPACRMMLDEVVL